MPDSCIIALAITGSGPRKRDNPARPVPAAEQIEGTQAACEAIAALVARVAPMAAAHARPGAIARPAREILGLPAMPIALARRMRLP